MGAMRRGQVLQQKEVVRVGMGAIGLQQSQVDSMLNLA